MGQFQALLRLPGDSRALTATVHINAGRLQVASGEHVIGDWRIDAIDISPIPEGIRVAAEGEVLLLDISDRAAFEQEAAFQTAKGKRFGRSKQTARPGSSRSAASSRAATAAAVKVKPPRPRGGSKLEVYLARAKERFGSNLPDWVFSRWGLAAVVGLLAFCVVFAELVSNLLLITGVVVLLVGGVTMLDSVIARRILHHKVTPIQVVIGGGSIFVVGLLIGLVA